MKTITTLLLFCCFLDAGAQCPGNLITNGSFNGILGEAITASGWVSMSTPDMNDASGTLHTTPGYVWTGTPVPSSDGGTWQNLFSDVETITQTLNVTAGQPYRLQFEYAAQGIEAPNMLFADPVGINIFLDDVLVEVTPDDNTQFTWESYCYLFIPQSNVVTLKLSASKVAYAAIDGMCLLPNSTDLDILGNDTIICPGQSLVLDATTPGANTYLWQDNSINPVYTVTQPGIYYVEITGSCNYTDTIRITNTTLEIFGNDTTLCPGETLVLDVTAPDVTAYLWQDNTTNPVYTVTQAGVYYVDITGNCNYTDTIRVTYQSTEIFGNDTTMCLGNTLLLNAVTQGATAYLWQDHSINPIHVVTQEGVYYVDITGACNYSDTIRVFYTNCEPEPEPVSELEMPNIFTPDNDGVNDFFHPKKLVNVKEARLQILNRWGQLMYETNNLQLGWNGKSDEQDCSEGTYFWIVNYTSSTNEQQALQGFLQLIR